MASKKKTVSKKNTEKKTGTSEKVRRWKRAYTVSIILLGSAVAIGLLIVLSGWLLVKYYYHQTDYIPDEDVVVYQTVPDDESLAIELYPEFESIEADRNAALSEQNAQIVGGSDNMYNLLLIGLDLRAGQNWNGNSDSMILVSVNTMTKKITMFSFMRDLYTMVPGVSEPKKLNYAHAVGGGPLLVQAIEENYAIDIDNYASVNFYDMIAIIDSLGGVDIEVSPEEAAVANKYYVDYLARETGVAPEGYYLTGGGVQHLNGLQTVAYARIRYVGNADYERTERQRRVLSKLFEKLKNLNPVQLNGFLETTLPRIHHNVDEATLDRLLGSVVTYLGYDLGSSRIPYDGCFTVWNEMLVPDYAKTLPRLQMELHTGVSE